MEGTRYQDPTVVEMAQHILKSRFIAKTLGGLFPENLSLSSLQNILEIACGVGAWSLEVANTYPDKRVIGIESNPLLLDYAESQRLAMGLENVQFHLVEQHSHLDITDAMIDLASGQFLLPRLSKDSWPSILQECQRVLRPAGYISFTECAFEDTNSQTLLTYYGYRTKVERLTGCACSAIETDHFIVARLLELLEEAEYQGIQHVIKPIDASFTQPEAWMFFQQNFIVQFKMLQPAIIAKKIATQTELDHLYKQILTEMRSKDFQATFHVFLVWGNKRS